jgi:hypothetical protein
MSTLTAPQADLFPDLLATLDVLDQSDRAHQLAQRVAPICVDEGKAYPAGEIQTAAATVLALREGQAEWPAWLNTHVKERPNTREATEARQHVLRKQIHKRSRGRWGLLHGGSLIFSGCGALLGGPTAALLFGCLLWGWCALGILLMTHPESQEFNSLNLRQLSNEDWSKLATSTQACALYRTWTSAGDAFTQQDWKALMEVAKLEAAQKAKQQVLAPIG